MDLSLCWAVKHVAYQVLLTKKLRFVCKKTINHNRNHEHKMNFIHYQQQHNYKVRSTDRDRDQVSICESFSAALTLKFFTAKEYLSHEHI